MSTLSTGPDLGLNADPSAEPECTEYLAHRDKEGPLSFAGILMAHARRQAGLLTTVETIEAKVYRTRGGSYVTSLAKYRQTHALGGLMGEGSVEDVAGPDTFGYRKAAVHKTFDSAMDWFKPGRLTDEIRKQLGLDKPVRIE